MSTDTGIDMYYTKKTGNEKNHIKSATHIENSWRNRKQMEYVNHNIFNGIH